MIPYGKQSVSRRDRRRVNAVLKSDFLTIGPEVSRFELELSKITKTDTFVVSSGTAALHCAYVGIGVGPGDEIITPPNTFIATQATAALLGARIVFADINPNTGLICSDSVAKKITNKTKAIVLVDYAGQICDVDSFRRVVRGTEIILIEDAAHSLGSTYKGKRPGELVDVTTFSFFPTKNITTAEGGAVSSPHPKILQRAKRFARQGVIREESEFTGEFRGSWVYEVHDFGLNYRLSDLQCSLGLSQLDKLSKFKKRRFEIFNLYKSRLTQISGVQIIEQDSQGDPMWHLFPILVKSGLRDGLFDFLRKHSIQVQVNYIPVMCQPVFQKMGYQYKDYPNSMKFYEEEISLPIFPDLSTKEVNFICDTIEKFFVIKAKKYE